MRILVLCTRPPLPGGKGDQSRCLEWSTHLARRHEVSVFAPDAGVALDAAAFPGIRWLPWSASRHRRAAGALGAARRREPAQTGWMTPLPQWRTAARLAADADVVLAMTARSLRGPLGPPVVLDHVDALSLNMERRSTGPENRVIRAFARHEARAFRRAEAALARVVAGQIVTSPEDAARLPQLPPPLVAPITIDPGIVERGYPAGDRAFDVVFSGNMRYPPNRDAAVRLTERILPRVRAVRPVTGLVVGRDATSLRLEGVEVRSDVEDVIACLGEARVAVAPLTLGTGTPYKLAEAAAAGAAIVTTPWGARSLGLPAAAATTDDELAAAIITLLSDERRRSDQAAAAHAHLRTLETPQVAGRVEDLLVRCASDAAAARAGAAGSPR